MLSVQALRLTLRDISPHGSRRHTVSKVRQQGKTAQSPMAGEETHLTRGEAKLNSTAKSIVGWKDVPCGQD